MHDMQTSLWRYQNRYLARAWIGVENSTGRDTTSRRLIFSNLTDLSSCLSTRVIHGNREGKK